MSEVKDKVVSIIVDKLGVDAAEVKIESSFTNDLGADSLDAVELIMAIEDEFEIKTLKWHISKITDYVDNARILLDSIPHQELSKIRIILEEEE